MRRYFLVIFILMLFISCCSISLPLIHSTATATFTSLPITATQILPTATLRIPSTVTPSPVTSTNTSPPLTTLTPPPEPFSILFHPDDVLYVGDQVSFEVVSPSGVDIKDASLQVQVDPPDGPRLGSVKFGPWGIQGRSEATMIWAWDTKNNAPGLHSLEFIVQPQGYGWTEQVTLQPANSMPANQASAHWAETKTQCCAVFYITDTASERDLSTLTAMIDAQAQDAIQKMGATFTEPITITILPRVLGHGGFTSTEISVSYLDRNYTSSSWDLVVHHEMIHAIDAHAGGDFKPTFFVEGLAVYLTGGHYKPEPLMPRTAALLGGYLNWYLPLTPLADDFYASQHEIGYLEAASLIEFMVNTYGEPAFFTFYHDIHNKGGESQSASIDAALQAHFSISFAQLEQNFIAALKAEPDTSAWVDDVRLEVTYFDTMRRYQQLLDPSAYFRTAWLLDNITMRQRNIVADYLRHPHTPANLALETLLITAGQRMLAGDYLSASRILEQISSVMDGIEHGTTDPFSSSMMASDYLSIASTLQQQDYDVQNITFSADNAIAHVTTSASPRLIQVTLQRVGGIWSIKP